ncbi:murein transglycosylase A [Pararhizobium sp. IMCC21322]|uniref:murein transglycosylase A n=1 Tax=Pararhizobium sp. IMCC21322 TaxID=3067903 RepID=UPI00274110A5|nr:MltA domain-containing protein [Pararhizobium sp. IMCC21322]
MQTALQALSYIDLPGWADDDHLAAFHCFLNSADIFEGVDGPKTRALGIDGPALGCVFAKARRQAAQIQDSAAAKAFFETHFTPIMFASDTPFAEYPGLLTAYFEPVVEGSLTRSEAFPIPLLRRPADLVETKTFAPEDIPEDLPEGLRFAKKTAQGLVPYFDRSEIEGRVFSDGALAGQGLEMVWLANHVDVFFIHIQGSASIHLQQGGTLRVSYDGKSGHDYTAIGKVLKDMGELAPGNIMMQTIKTWLLENPDRQLEILHQNRSFIFFQEEKNLQPDLGPRATAGVQLTQGRSLAVDRVLHTFHTPIFVSYSRDGAIDNRLMIAQDTGSAIVGPHRGDYFAGSGSGAGETAGGFAASCRFVVLMPRAQDLPT